MELNRVTIEDYESIIAFYDDVTDRTPYMEQYARWKKGLHPTHDGIRAYIEEGIADFMHAIGDESYLSMHRFYGAYQDNKLVGVIAARNDHHHIGLLFVDKSYQRKGIGRQLIQHILEMKDEEPITVNASPYGHGFYKKLGFVDTSEEQITNGVRYFPMKK